MSYDVRDLYDVYEEGDSFWSRIEPMSRDDEMRDGLRAEIADPAWLLTRQWQLGEFQGEDAGSPVDVEVEISHDHLTRYQLLGDADEQGKPVVPQEYDGGPLETVVEREAITGEMEPPSASLAARAGVQFVDLLEEELGRSVDVDTVPSGYLMDVPADEDAPMYAEAQRFASFVNDRVIDGDRVYRAIDAAIGASAWSAGSVTFPWEAIQGVTGPSEFPTPAGVASTDSAFKTAATTFHEWYGSLYEEPGDEGEAWNPERLEYDARVSTGGPGGGSGHQATTTETVLEARGYRGGTLNWYDFGRPGGTKNRLLQGPDLYTEQGDSMMSDAEVDEDYTTQKRKHVMPTEATFKGMPSSRYWEFENADVRLDEVASDDVTSQILINFALVYGNDWYTFPLDTPLGSLTRITSLTVTDTFGETYSIDHVGTHSKDDTWNVFSYRRLQNHGQPGLFLPPVLDGGLRSDPVEEISLHRDQMANYAFAVESKVEGPTGDAVDRSEYVRPDLVIEEIHANPEIAEEYVALHNPGARPIDVGGWIVTDGQSATFQFPTDTTVGPDTTVTVHSGTEPAGGSDATDFYWGRTESDGPVWFAENDAVVLSVYDADTTPSAVTSGDPLAHLEIRERIPKKSGEDPAAAAYELATNIPDHWFVLQPRADEKLVDTGTDTGIGDLMQYRYDHKLALALVLDADTLDVETIADLPDPEGEILRPYPEDPSRHLEIYEEELMRGGKQVSRSYQRATWTDGSAYLWSGREVTPGKGEVGSSTLAFDILKNWTTGGRE